MRAFVALIMCTLFLGMSVGLTHGQSFLGQSLPLLPSLPGLNRFSLPLGNPAGPTSPINQFGPSKGKYEIGMRGILFTNSIKVERTDGFPDVDLVDDLDFPSSMLMGEFFVTVRPFERMFLTYSYLFQRSFDVTGQVAGARISIGGTELNLSTAVEGSIGFFGHRLELELYPLERHQMRAGLFLLGELYDGDIQITGTTPAGTVETADEGGLAPYGSIGGVFEYAPKDFILLRGKAGITPAVVEDAYLLEGEARVRAGVKPTDLYLGLGYRYRAANYDDDDNKQKIKTMFQGPFIQVSAGF